MYILLIYAYFYENIIIIYLCFVNLKIFIKFVIIYETLNKII